MVYQLTFIANSLNNMKNNLKYRAVADAFFKWSQLNASGLIKNNYFSGLYISRTIFKYFNSRSY